MRRSGNVTIRKRLQHWSTLRLYENLFIIGYHEGHCRTSIKYWQRCSESAYKGKMHRLGEVLTLSRQCNKQSRKLNISVTVQVGGGEVDTLWSSEDLSRALYVSGMMMYTSHMHWTAGQHHQQNYGSLFPVRTVTTMMYQWNIPLLIRYTARSLL